MDTVHSVEAAVNGTGNHNRNSSPHQLDGNDPRTIFSSKPNGHVPNVSDVDLASGTSQEEIVEAIIEGLRVAGGCIIRNMVSKDALDEIEREIRPHLDTAKVWKGSFYPPESRRVTGCVNKSQAYALNIVGHPVFHAVGNYFLTSQLVWNWVGTETNERSISVPQLSSATVYNTQPGARNMPLHRDDDAHHNQQLSSAVHHLGRDTALTFFVAGTNSTRLNGATRFVPGSHLWDYSQPPPFEDYSQPPPSEANPTASGVMYAELKPGDGLLLLAGTYHAASANMTKDEERLLYSAGMTRGWMRQEENQYLAVDKERVRELPVALQRFIGYGLSMPFAGYVDLGDPIKVLGGDAGEGVDDLY